LEFDAHQLTWTLISITDIRQEDFEPSVGISHRTLHSRFASN
jgi:hypothetical protein